MSPMDNPMSGTSIKIRAIPIRKIAPQITATINNGFVAVAEYRNGVIVCYENAPRWVTSLADAINQP